jgi:hypothetical protein
VVALLIALALPQAADAQVSELAVVGHRGASGDRPENTVPALWRAARLGADWVEMDVRATRPGTRPRPQRPATAEPAGGGALAVVSANVGEL